MKKILHLLCLLAIIITAQAQNTNWQQKIDPSLLEKAAEGNTVPFVALLAQQADLSAARWLKTKDEKAHFAYAQLRQTASSTQAGLVAFFNHKNLAYESLFIVNAIKSSGNLAVIEALAQRADVALVMDNADTYFEPPIDRGGIGLRAIEWGIEKINADDVWAMGFQGQGVTVGGQDTGYEWQHPALIEQYRGYHAPTDTFDHNYNWHDAIHAISPLSPDSINPCGLNSPFPCDDNNHGTHTMGTMIGHDGVNEIGVAPQAKWCACRNMERGNGSPFTYLECFQWFLAPTDLNGQNPDPTKAPHVINNSWFCSQGEGCNPSNTFVMEQAVNNLRLAGTVVVVSAGNSGSSCGSVANPPGYFENSFSVGATDINDTIAGFSSRGPVTVDGSGRLKPNVSAPGVSVRSAVRFGGYASFSGTSMAGPHVAGLVALVISANPDLAGQVELIEDIIEQTAVPLFINQECGGINAATQTPNNTYGYGRVDALAAVEEALTYIVNPATEVAGAAVKVFPNPFSSMLSFQQAAVVGPVGLELYDTNGRLLLKRSFEGSIALDLSNQPAGIYFYRLFQNGEVQRGKLVKQ
jgi:subtilisin family serine protease